MHKLFTPVNFQNIKLKNRIVMSPMCMYSCFDQDGMITPFHFTHLVSRAVGQVGLVITEATAVLPEGRISPQDLGIWNNDHIDGLKRLNERLHEAGTKTGVQLAHAGRKAVLESDTYAPSAIPFSDSYKVPNEMTAEDIERTVEAFGKAARRAREANFDIVEIHGAHGYLINEFLSPLTNHRTDAYGGTVVNRYRFLSEIIESVKVEWNGPIFVRISTDEYHEDGNTMDNILYFTNRMSEQGIELIDCSSGGVVSKKVHAYPGYQVPRCDTIKQHTEVATGAVGLITTGIQAEEILQNNRADVVVVGRALLRNPYWPKAAADELGEPIEAPAQYKRGWR